MVDRVDRIRKKLTGLATGPGMLAVAKRALRAFPEVDEQIRIAHYKLVSRLRPRHVSPVAATSGRTPYFMVDVSQVVRSDGRTGIERVVRSLLLELVKTPPAGFTVVPVYVDDAGTLRQGEAFLAAMLERPASRADHAVAVQLGDIWFTADVDVQVSEAALEQLRRHGVRIIFTVYDLLPLRTPEYFYRAQALRFDDWLRVVLRTADCVMCDSRTVADDLVLWINEHPGVRLGQLPIGHFHLGADIDASSPTTGMSPHDLAVLSAVKNLPTLLMVGTIEPRKGHRQVLDAMECLWREGMELQLVIVGKEGWRSHDLVQRILEHSLRDVRLFWLPRASDAVLQELYANTSALVAASANEGFGLPLIEAAQHGLRIIARDIPVFREVAGSHAFYFHDDDPESLARTFVQWLELHAHGQAPASRDMRFLRWSESTQQLIDAILFGRWDHVWS